MKNGLKVVIVMPAYNTAHILEETYRDIPKEGISEIILVDDGSSDGTAALAERLGITVIRHKKNKGYGAAQKTGYREALRRGADIVVMVHSDYQYDPTLTPKFIQLIASGIADAVTGSRMITGGALKGGMPLWKYIPNRFLTMLENLAFATRLTDYHNGFRAYSRDVLESIPFEDISDKFDFDTDILIQVILRKFRISEVAHRTRYRKQSSQMSFSEGVEYGLRIILTIIKFKLHQYGIKRSKTYEAQSRRASQKTSLVTGGAGFIGLFLVLLVTFLIYFPSLFYHFVGDDYVALAKIVTSSNLKQVVSFCWPALYGGYFRPLNWLPFVLGYTLVGLPLPPDPRWQIGSFLAAYHLLNPLFHLANVFLIYLIASFIFKSRIYSIISSLIFAIHPINSEVVCWVAAVADITQVFFSLLSIILFARFYMSSKKVSSLLYYLGSLLSFIMALGSKEVAVSLPFLIILTALFLYRSGYASIKNKRKIISISGYFLLLIFYFILRKFVLPIVGFPWQYFLKNIPFKLFKLVYYLRDLAFPVNLALLKEFLYRYSLLPLFIIIVLLLGGLFLYILILKFRRLPVVIFSLFWIALTLIVPILVPFSPMRRHLYFPLVGFCIFLVSFISLFKKKYIGISFLSLFIVLEAGTTLERNNLYRIASGVVQRGLFELKKALPEIKPDSIIYLVGIPGTAKNTPVFWGAPEAKIITIYKERNLPVFCLSLITFTEKNLGHSEINFLDDFTFIQSMQTNLEEFIRVVGEDSREQDGQWRTASDAHSQFKILKRDKFGNVERAMFRLSPQVLKGKKVYFVGFKNGKVQVLRSFQAN